MMMGMSCALRAILLFLGIAALVSASETTTANSNLRAVDSSLSAIDAEPQLSRALKDGDDDDDDTKAPTFELLPAAITRSPLPRGEDDDDDDDDDNSLGAIGVGVGIAVGVLACGGIAGALVAYKMKRDRKSLAHVSGLVVVSSDPIQGIVVEDFFAKDVGELSIQLGQRVLIEQTLRDGWVRGTNEFGSSGMFPARCIRAMHTGLQPQQATMMPAPEKSIYPQQQAFEKPYYAQQQMVAPIEPPPRHGVYQDGGYRQQTSRNPEFYGMPQQPVVTYQQYPASSYNQAPRYASPQPYDYNRQGGGFRQ